MPGREASESEILSTAYAAQDGEMTRVEAETAAIETLYTVECGCVVEVEVERVPEVGKVEQVG